MEMKENDSTSADQQQPTAANVVVDVEKDKRGEEEGEGEAEAETEEALPLRSKMALSEDPTKVKFTSSKSAAAATEGEANGEAAKVDIENVQLAFAGMGKEELMSYADDPFWVKLRWSLFGLFWLLWAAMLVGAIAIVVTTPGCPPLPARQWWQKGVVYQVYPRSFKDSDGDGVGDLKGIESELNYFKELGVNTLWLNPVYQSPMDDGGFDISDFKSIDPVFGTMEDFARLVQSAHENDLYVVVEFVPNHSSKEHEWFVKSRNRTGKYADYYVWNAGKNGPPNNWKSVFGNSSWTYDGVRGEYYYHQFLPSQPDLNLRSEDVRNELKDILKFWLDLGVDGFRVDAVKHLFEDEALLDEPFATNETWASTAPDYKSLNHIYTAGLPENLDVLREWREVLSTYQEKDGKHRLLMVEAYDGLREVMSYYGNETDPLADFPFNFFLLGLNEASSAKDVAAIVSSWNASLPSGKWSNWLLGNHDVSRVATRTGAALVDAYNAIIMLLVGTPVTYYGEEIGMVDVPVPYGLSVDKKGLVYGEEKYREHTRDFSRTPMQWNGQPGAGFTNSSSPWLPIGSDHKALNVEMQRTDPESHLEIYKKLVKLRKEAAFLYGDFRLANVEEDVFSFFRVKKGSVGFAVFVNFGRNATRVDVAKSGCCGGFDFKLPENGIVELRSGGNATVLPPKSKIPFNGFALGPSEVVVVNFVPKFDD